MLIQTPKQKEVMIGFKIKKKKHSILLVMIPRTHLIAFLKIK